ncbi:thermonuclease family protein [Eoetvoesiella caeni]
MKKAKLILRAVIPVFGISLFSQMGLVSAETTSNSCSITSVHDGDTMRLRCPGNKKSIAVRLEQIDAPEIGQAYGIQARDYLRSICPVGTTAVLSSSSKDRYGRTLGQVHCNGTDANASMISSGSAWVYDHYAQDQGLYTRQALAKEKRIGLWANYDVMAPWEFRKMQRK